MAEVWDKASLSCPSGTRGWPLGAAEEAGAIAAAGISPTRKTMSVMAPVPVSSWIFASRVGFKNVSCWSHTELRTTRYSFLKRI